MVFPRITVTIVISIMIIPILIPIACKLCAVPNHLFVQISGYCATAKGNLTRLSCELKTDSYRRGTARRAVSVEIMSTAKQLYEKSHFERHATVNDLDGHSRSSKLPPFDSDM